MLRLTVQAQGTAETVLRIEGWVTGKEVELLDREISRLLVSAGRLVLDLGGVRSISPGGVELLHRWPGRLELRGGSDFVRLALERHGGSRKPRTNHSEEH